MKNYTILITFMFALALMSCENTNKKVSTDVVKNTKSAVEHAELGTSPAISFEKVNHDFGDVIQGEKVTYSFQFHNTGGSELLITKVSTSCGCTVGKYPKEPIKPGQGSEIEVTFDTHRRKGIQNKTITVLANTEPNNTQLRIKANVVLPENQ
ncbi:MAG: DUF1573 domain-containing protein [Bacteroidetes bacterium]|nr:DUF1573 domain-containing protein [Bacteroidota bacterium]